MEKVFIYDSTLRDGAQGEGISFSDSGKMRFAHLMDDFGIDFVEGGFAGSNPRDQQFFHDARKEHFAHATITAFGSTRRPELAAEKDPQLAGLLAAETETVTIYGKSWKLHVKDVLGTTPENNLAMIADTVGYLKGKGRRVFFDAEHFFDGYRDDPAYALKVVETALSAGALGAVLCDTNGGRLPHEIYEIVKTVCAAFPAALIGIHAHNDSGVGVGNTLEAVRAGARQVQGTINGYGERTGNANLTSIIPDIELKLGFTCVGEKNLRRLREVSIQTDDLANQRPDPHQPYVGETAFSHKAGMHVNAVRKNSKTFEHIAPEQVGNQRHILVSELSGVSNILMKAQELGVDTTQISKEESRAVLAELKAREQQGYSYESADGSFRILLQKVLKRHPSFFELEGFRVIVEKRGRDVPCISEATIKVKVGDQTEITAGEGDGPVDALNAALRKALLRFYPEIADIILTDYRVRILDPKQATRAMTRVLIESGDKAHRWGTVGVSENIIEASWQALLDSVEHKLFETQGKR